jgi:5-amino-6-(5-phospho-D-ribitylamino)uracil phosphatase
MTGVCVPPRTPSSILRGMSETTRYRALAFDLDGTLLTRDEEVSPRNLAAVRAARAAGYQLIVASARWRHLAARVANEIGAVEPLVACSGAEVWDRVLRHDLLDLRLPAAFAEALYQICDAQRCIATVVLDDEVVVRMEGDPDRSQMPPEMRPAKSLRLEAPGHPRIALIQGTEVNAIVREELSDAWGESVRFVESISSRGKSILTLTAAGADKGVALAVACAHLDVPLDQVVSFGDAENDIEMFRVTGASVAMGQAAEHVRAHASFTTASNAEDGVAVAIEHLLRDGTLG